MNDDSYIDVNCVLDKPEKWARETLRNHGFTDDFIDEWMQMDDGSTAVDDDLITTTYEYMILLLRHIENLRDRLSNRNQSPIDWIWDGYVLAWFFHASSLNESAKLWDSDRQSNNSSGPRKRKGVADDVVDYVLDSIPREDRGMTGFREYVIRHTTLDLEYAKIDVTPVYELEGSKEKITHFVLENRSVSDGAPEARKEVKISTIRSSIYRYPQRLKKRSIEK